MKKTRAVKSRATVPLRLLVQLLIKIKQAPFYKGKTDAQDTGSEIIIFQDFVSVENLYKTLEQHTLKKTKSYVTFALG
jgi:hypothetical protein